MTSPLDRLAGLSITGRMSQRTRVEAQRERRRRERQERTTQAAVRGVANTNLPTPDAQGAIQGGTRLRYNVGTLRSPVQATAIRGLTADNLIAEAAKAHSLDENDSYVAIQVVERLRLCIYTSPREGRQIDCSCVEMRRGGSTSICPHIYWIYDRLISNQQPTEPQSIWPVNLTDVERVLGQITSRSSAEIDHLAEEISPKWTEPDDDIDHEVEDMLAVLDSDNDRLAGDYDEEFYSSLPNPENHHLQDLVVPGDPFKTIFVLARHDSAFRERLSAAIGREGSDRIVLRKLHRRRVSAFSQLKSYVRKGTKLNHQEIALCSMKLRNIIIKMEEYRERVYEFPNPAFDRGCAKLAIKILQEVCNWNRDIYADTIWLKEPSPAAIQDRNLYICIISGRNQPPNTDNHFILNFLIDDLPSQACIAYLRELNEISTKLVEFKAPAPLITKLQNFIQDVRHEPQLPLAEIENYQSLTPSTTRSNRTDSQSSNGSCPSNDSNTAGPSTGHTRRPSSLELPEAQRRRIQ